MNYKIKIVIGCAPRAAVDILENTSILLAMHVFTGQNWVLSMAGILTMLKWLFLLLYLLAAVCAVIYNVRYAGPEISS